GPRDFRQAGPACDRGEGRLRQRSPGAEGRQAHRRQAGPVRARSRVDRMAGWRSMQVARATLATAALAALAAASPAPTGPRRPAPDYSVLIRGGTIYDGSGSAGYVGDVAVRGDKIVYV